MDDQKGIQKTEPGGAIEEFGAFDPKALDDEDKFVEQAEAGDFLKLPEGDTIVRAYPPPAGEAMPYLLVYEHAIKAPGMNFPFRFPCPRLMARQPCSFCAKAEALKASGNKADRKLAGELQPRRRGYMDVIGRANPEHGPFIFAFGTMIHNDLKEILRKPAKGGDFSHAVNGRDLIITRKGTTRDDTEYSVTASMEKSPFAPDAETMRRWLGLRHDFSRFVLPKTDAENQRDLEEAADRAESGGAESRTTRGGTNGRGAGRPPRLHASIDDDDDKPFG
jgi:hypothetical protein